MMICFGSLNWGVGPFGLSYLNLNNRLGNTWWNYCSRNSEQLILLFVMLSQSLGG
jgi:hypothetical protein